MENLSLLSWFLLALIVAAALLYFWLDSSASGIRFISVEFPYVFGNIGEKQLALQLTDIYKNHRDMRIVGIRLLFNSRALIINDLDLVKMVLVGKFSHFQNRGLFHNEKDDPLSAILGTVDHGAWKPMRKKLTPAFTTRKMQDIFPQLKDMCDVLVEHLRGMTNDGERNIEILGLFSRFTTDAIGEIAFGNNSQEQAAQLREMVLKSKQPYLQFPFNRLAVAFPKLARWLRIRKHSKEVTDFFVNFVSEIVNYRAENGVRLNDFMQSLIDAELGIPRITAIAFDLLSAGYADATSTLAYCLYELSLNQNIQDFARDEVQNILETTEFTYDALQKMTYCMQLIQETERKYPVAGIATRVATETCPIPDTDMKIPRGMKVFVPIYAIHHDEEYYPNPEIFDPERFTEEAKKTRPNNAFLPFGLGPRQCIGFRFAEMLVGIGLVSLLKNFEFSTCEETRIPIEFNQNKNTLHPKSDVTLKVRRI